MKSLYASLWQHPDEDAMVINATRGCSYNACSFCGLYKDTPFALVDLDTIRAALGRIPRDEAAEIPTVFLGDGNALSAGPAHLRKVLALIRDTLPAARRISAGATVQDIMKKKPATLRDLRKAGLNALYVGMESGDPDVLKAMGKGTTPDMIIRAGRRAIDAGMNLTLTVLLGAGGRGHKREHIARTAAVLKAVNPHLVAIQTLTLMSGTPLFDQVKRGEYAHPTPIEATIELRSLIEALDLDGTFVHSDHPSNTVHVAGYLPEEKEEILHRMDGVLNNPTDAFLTADYFRRGT